MKFGIDFRHHSPLSHSLSFRNEATCQATRQSNSAGLRARWSAMVTSNAVQFGTPPYDEYISWKPAPVKNGRKNWGYIINNSAIMLPDCVGICHAVPVPWALLNCWNPLRTKNQPVQPVIYFWRRWSFRRSSKNKPEKMAIGDALPLSQYCEI